ncbi:MAG: TRAP transporter fused permease subunit [Azospirillaceae bacterium]
MTASDPPESGAPPGSDPTSMPAAGASTRPLDGTVGRAVFWIGVALSLGHVWYNTFGLMSEVWRNALHFAGFGAMCALVFPLVPAEDRGRRRLWLAVDIALGLVLLAAIVYILASERQLSNRSFTDPVLDTVMLSIPILLAIEFTRRTTGWIIPVLIVLAISYIAWWGKYLGGALHFPGLSTEIVLLRSIYGEDGMFGSIARISSSFVFMFILFGAFLLRSGAGDFIIDLARALAGRMAGGPGFVAVIGSALTGTISGSAVANTVSTGVITIPLMKRSGFPARFAAGVESASSTGGQLMPPIMGAGAFVMAEYTGVPYLEIVAVAFLPALMYFLGVAFNVRIVAKREGLRPTGESGPALGMVMKRGGVAFLVPIAVLIGLLIMDYTPTYAAGIAIVAVVVSSWVTPNRMGPRAILEALSLGARNMVLTAVLLVAVGLIVNVIATSGLGNTFSLMVSDWAGGNLLIAMVLVALASLVLGMGLPVTAAYIVLAALSAPALFDMIAQTAMATRIAAGEAPQMLQAVMMLAAPDAAARLGEPMSLEAARALLAQVPPEMAGQVRDALLSEPARITALISAHMIIFWLSQDSNVTPPVCLTAFAAAAIAGTKPMATGFAAWKIAKTLYIVPLLFAYTPFLSGDPLTALAIFAFGTAGVYALIAALEGHAEAPVPHLLRPVLVVIGAALLWPGQPWLHLAGALALAVFLVVNVRAGRRLAAA